MIEASKVHFVGIGGIGMSALAHILLDRGYRVSGSDLKSSYVTEHLAAAGAVIYLGHNPANVDGAELVVVTSAARQENVELVEALKRGIRVIKRAELLGVIMSEKQGVGVAGTHGKTTTTWMVTHILQQAGLDPGYAIGGSLPTGQDHGHDGDDPIFVAEADEYDGSFLRLHPSVASVNNIEPDHLDFYRDLNDIAAAFHSFVQGVRPGGLAILNADDPLCMSIAGDLPGVRVQTFSLERAANWQAADISAADDGGSRFEVIREGVSISRVKLPVPGRHNVANSLAAIAVCAELGVDPAAASVGLGSFSAVKRRFELKGIVDGVTVIDDYAHHPSEIMATLQAARQQFPSARLWAVFQPHTYSRTKTLLPEFAGSFGMADSVIIAGIFAARETDTLGISGEDIVRAMRAEDAVYIESLESIVEYMDDRLRPGDVLLTLGAGDVWKVAEDFIGQRKTRR